MKGEHKQPACRAISPMAQVPTLELDDGTGLTESRSDLLVFRGAVRAEPDGARTFWSARLSKCWTGASS